MMDNPTFLKAISASFHEFLKAGTSRSTAKLKPLHGAIAADFQARLGDTYTVKAQGFGNGREGKVQGRYLKKAVDIAIYRNSEPVAGIAVKFIMQNYAQNSNNYFEGMLGETANIRSHCIPYFQIFILLDRLPYYNRTKTITRWETFTAGNVTKYAALSHDNVDVFFHTPNKTLIYVLHIPDNDALTCHQEYIDFYRQQAVELTLSPTFQQEFGTNVLLNDYASFAEKVYHTIKAL